MIRAADGLEYESITAKLKNEPADTVRNKAIQRLREQGRSDAFIATFAQGWDAFEPHEDSEDGSKSGFFAAYEEWKLERDRTRARAFAAARNKAFVDKFRADRELWGQIADRVAFTALAGASGTRGKGPGSLRFLTDDLDPAGGPKSP